MDFNSIAIKEFESVSEMNEYLTTMSKADGIITKVREVFNNFKGPDKLLYIVETVKPIYVPRNPTGTAAATKKEDKPASNGK
jgi:hypothetical protein